jgi:hypothetical protein
MEPTRFFSWARNEFLATRPEQTRLCRVLDVGPKTGGRSCGEPVAMRALVPLDRTMQLPLTLAGGLRTTFADVVSSPLPGRLAALMRRLHADRDERSGEERNDGASATKKSSRIDR